MVRVDGRGVFLGLTALACLAPRAALGVVALATAVQAMLGMLNLLAGIARPRLHTADRRASDQRYRWTAGNADMLRRGFKGMSARTAIQVFGCQRRGKTRHAVAQKVCSWHFVKRVSRPFGRGTFMTSSR